MARSSGTHIHVHALVASVQMLWGDPVNTLVNFGSGISDRLASMVN